MGAATDDTPFKIGHKMPLTHARNAQIQKHRKLTVEFVVLFSSQALMFVKK